MSKVDLKELARDLVLRPDWRVMPGMLDVNGDRVSRVEDGRAILDRRVECGFDCTATEAAAIAVEDFVPDLVDYATIGCLKGLMREVEGHPEMYARPVWHQGAWLWSCDPFSPIEEHHPTEVQAVVACFRPRKPEGD